MYSVYCVNRLRTRIHTRTHTHTQAHTHAHTHYGLARSGYVMLCATHNAAKPPEKVVTWDLCSIQVELRPEWRLCTNCSCICIKSGTFLLLYPPPAESKKEQDFLHFRPCNCPAVCTCKVAHTLNNPIEHLATAWQSTEQLQLFGISNVRATQHIHAALSLSLSSSLTHTPYSSPNVHTPMPLSCLQKRH